MPTFDFQVTVLLPRLRYSAHQDDFVDPVRALREIGFLIHSIGKESCLVTTPPGWRQIIIDNGNLIEYRDLDNKVRVKHQKNGRDGLNSVLGEHLIITGYQ